ncbi:MAG: S-layer homology domain-containing protein [Firmicutes bacterium]|nr:S-layer homology domain-containing protein [Bacillota bacterium]
MKINKSSVIIYIICILITFSNMNVAKANEVTNIKLDTHITNWVYDNNNDNIYAINKQNSELIIIDSNDFKILDTKELKEKPIDIKVYENKIYIAFENTKKIDVFDTKNKSKIKEIDIQGNPEKIEIVNKKIFYIESKESWKKINIYEMENDIKKKTEKSFHDPDIVLDRSKKVLYIAESGNSESKLFAMDTNSYQILKSTENILYPDKGVHISGDYIIYNKKSSTLNDLNNRVGYYKGNAIYADKGFLFTEFSIFDIKTNKKISTLPDKTKLVLMDEKENIYLYDEENNKIYRYSSLYDIDPKLNETLKIYINDYGHWIFTWDKITNTQGYNLWYKVGSEIYDNSKLTRLNKEVIKENKFVLKNLPKEIENKTVFIAVTPKAENIDFDIVKENMKKISVNKFKELNNYLREFNLGEENAVNLDFIATKVENYNKDIKTGDIVIFNEMLFNTLLDKVGTKITSYNLECEFNNKLMINIPGSSFLKLYDKSDKKIIIKADNYNIELPIDKFDAIRKYPNIKESNISIEIQKNIKEDKGIIDPFKLDIRINRNKTSEEVKSVGKGYINFKISVDDNFKNIVGINLGNNFKHVPIKYSNEQGNFLNLQINGSGIYTLIENKNKKTFNDIKKHWANNEINLFKSNYILKGKDDEKFHPNANITRAEFITILVRALGINSNDIQLTFNDINKSDWFYNPVNEGVSFSLMKGYSKDLFKPNEFITREEMAVIIYRTSKLFEMENKDGENINYSDFNNINDWAKDEVSFVIKSGLMKGYGNDKFYPKKSATRAESVVVIKRLLEKLNFIK